MRFFAFLTVAAALTTCAMTTDASAQPMIQQSVPFQNLGSSFFENNGVSWNLRGPNFFANFGGGGLAPAFGNADPNAGLRTGVGFSGGGVQGSLGFNFSQGSNRSNVSTVPSVTSLNGVPGTITSQTLRPFVTGITPVVGGQALIPMGTPAPNPTIQAYHAGQQQDLQRRLQANYARTQKKALEYFNRGLRAEEEGNLKMARANFRRALSTSQGTLRLEVQRHMQNRGW